MGREIFFVLPEEGPSCVEDCSCSGQYIFLKLIRDFLYHKDKLMKLLDSNPYTRYFFVQKKAFLHISATFLT